MADTITNPSKYLRELFNPDDAIALTLIRRHTGRPDRSTFTPAVVQRFGLAKHFASPGYQQWLFQMNERGFEIYSTANTIRADATNRNKSSIAEIRHMYLDFDVNGDSALEVLMRRYDLPRPNYVVHTSTGKHQVLWRVTGFDATSAENLLRAMSRDTGADIPATDCNRVLRLPGYRNHKYLPPYFVTAERYHAMVFTPAQFPTFPDPGSTSPVRTTELASFADASPQGVDESKSGRDWRTALSRLRRGEDPQAVVEDLARYRANDKSDPRYYATRTVERALALIARTPQPRSCSSRGQRR